MTDKIVDKVLDGSKPPVIKALEQSAKEVKNWCKICGHNIEAHYFNNDCQKNRCDACDEEDVGKEQLRGQHDFVPCEFVSDLVHIVRELAVKEALKGTFKPTPEELSRILLWGHNQQRSLEKALSGRILGRGNRRECEINLFETKNLLKKLNEVSK